MGNRKKEVHKNDEPTYQEPKYTERPMGPVKTILWNQIQKVLEGVVPDYENTAKEAEKSRKRMQDKEPFHWGMYD